jgi:hypothetical protein
MHKCILVRTARIPGRWLIPPRLLVGAIHHQGEEEGRDRGRG